MNDERSSNSTQMVTTTCYLKRKTNATTISNCGFWPRMLMMVAPWWFNVIINSFKYLILVPSICMFASDHVLHGVMWLFYANCICIVSIYKQYIYIDILHIYIDTIQYQIHWNVNVNVNVNVEYCVNWMRNRIKLVVYCALCWLNNIEVIFDEGYIIHTLMMMPFVLNMLHKTSSRN